MPGLQALPLAQLPLRKIKHSACRLRRQMPGECGTVPEPQNGKTGALLKLQGEEAEPYPIGEEITVFASPEGF